MVRPHLLSDCCTVGGGKIVTLIFNTFYFIFSAHILLSFSQRIHYALCPEGKALLDSNKVFV